MHKNDRGIAAIWAAITLFFVLGVAAISVDAGGLFSRAYDQQRSGDFACLAGVVELPDSPEDARTVAAGYLASNLRGLPQPGVANGFDPTIAVWDLTPYGQPWRFELDPAWGTDTQMRVKVTKYEETHFGKVLGANQVEIDQESYCELFGAVPGGVFPVGVPTGFTGGKLKFSASDCSLDSPSGPGQCDYVDVPRSNNPLGTDGAGSAPARLMFNIWLGANQPLGTIDPPDPSNPLAVGPVECGITPGPRCSILEMGGVAGNRAATAYQGLIQGEANGSATNRWLGHLEFGRQPKPLSQRSIQGWTHAHSANVWNTNLITNTATVTGCRDSLGNSIACPNADDTLAGATWEVDEYNCLDRRFVWLPEGEFIGPGAAQKFHITGFLTAYIVDPIPLDTNSDGRRSSPDADPIVGNQVTEISAIVVDLTDAEFRSGSAGCPVSPFFNLGEPVLPRLIAGP